MLFISDLHHPYVHPKAFDFCRRVQNKFKTNYTLLAGDEADQSQLSVKYQASPDGLSAGEELDETIKSLTPWYRHFKDAVVLESNHTSRVFKKAFSAGIPNAFLKTYREFLKAPEGWMWVPETVIDGVHYTHGEMFNQSSWKTGFDVNYESIAIGHLHSGGGVVFKKNRKGTFFALNSGCLIDVTARVFDYAKHSKNKPTLGCGVIIDGIGQFIPMLEGGRC